MMIARRRARISALLAAVLAASLVTGGAFATGSVVGKVVDNTPYTCLGEGSIVSTTDPPDASYTVETAQLLTSWTTAGSGALSTATRALQIWRPTATADRYLLTYLSPEVTLNFDGLQTFPLAPAPKMLPGDRLGLATDGLASNCAHEGGTLQFLEYVEGGHVVGQEYDLDHSVEWTLSPNISATLQQPWTLQGFTAPVDMNGVVNTVKGGSTVPLKFEVFDGTTEITDTAAVAFSVQQTSCENGAAQAPIEATSTGGTSLRYDTTAGHFVQNWKTPKASPGTCYTATVTTTTGSTLTALFQLK